MPRNKEMKVSTGKRSDGKVENIDLSGYPGPGLGPMTPCPPNMEPGNCPNMPGYKPPGNCPDMPKCPENTLAHELKEMLHQKVTVYVCCMGGAPMAGGCGGIGIPAGQGNRGITGMLHEVGINFLELHMDDNQMGHKEIYIPFHALAGIAPGEPLVSNPGANVNPQIDFFPEL